MNEIIVSSKLQFLNEEDYLEVNGGIATEIVVALITTGVVIAGGAIKMDMESAVEQGKNDAWNAIKEKTTA